MRHFTALFLIIALIVSTGAGCSLLKQEEDTAASGDKTDKAENDSEAEGDEKDEKDEGDEEKDEKDEGEEKDDKIAKKEEDLKKKEEDLKKKEEDLKKKEEDLKKAGDKSDSTDNPDSTPPNRGDDDNNLKKGLGDRKGGLDEGGALRRGDGRGDGLDKGGLDKGGLDKGGLR